MKNFLKVVVASTIGTFTAFAFAFFVLVGMVAAMSAVGGGKEDKWASLGVKDQSVLRVDFKGPIVDHLEKKDIVSSIFRYDEPPAIGLFEMTQVLKKAAKDDRIKGLFLNMKYVGGGMANVEALRREVKKFKDTGKFVIAFAEVYTEKAYVLASVADEVILYPKGYFEWDGVFSKLSFFKNTLSKLDITPQIFRAGKYKSAIEPFIADKMSPANREQIQSIILTMWNQVLGYAKEKTQAETSNLDQMANDASVIRAQEAFKNGFVNFLSSFEDVERKLVDLTGVEEKPNYTGWRSYLKEMKSDKGEIEGDKIAVVFARGEIVSGKGEEGQIGSDSLSKILRKLSRDKDVKAVVIRVNSPGGSALASDVIWRSTQYLKDKKPVVTSFGNLAASGGYYMSAGSNYIFAEPSTITGSIGVFGLGFSTEKFWNENVGVTFDTEKTHRYSDLDSLVRILKPDEVQKMQGLIDGIYDDFLNVVVLGRKALSSREQAHEIAQGRVWTGKSAIEIGLVDELGGMEKATAKAAELAQIADYEVEVYPKEKSPFEEFIVQFGDVSMKTLKSIVPDSLVKVIQSKEKKSPLSDQIYTRVPFDITIQ